jgi:predicted DCC family thiol-disulfide oxidoreductase YuxK
MAEKLEELNVVLFDGVCNFCNGAINFLMDRDKSNQLRFAPLQSDAGQALLKKHNLPTSDFDSFVFITGGQVYRKSTAAVHIAKKLQGAWKALYGFVIVPRFIRDMVYSTIARNRYKWFGKQEACRIPTPEEKARFLA